MWALGVITYFLLCGYTPFDRQNSMDEMHAILNAEYQFAPIEYWQGVSETGMLPLCLVILIFGQQWPFNV
jgi:serine/threonine protein kinase